jgi:hypothetical protein
MGIGGVGAIEVTAVRTRGLDGLLMYEDEADGAGKQWRDDGEMTKMMEFTAEYECLNVMT